MATETDGTQTPQKVVELATETAKLDTTALLGIFGPPAARGALIRLPGGTIARVTSGDEVAGGTVEAIGEDRLVLTRMGTNLVLKMPHG